MAPLDERARAKLVASWGLLGQAPKVLTIRSGVASDIPDVLALWEGSAAVTRVPSDAAAIRRLLERDPDALVVGVVGGRVIGTVISGWDGWRCHLYRIAVDPTHRRSGTASKLLDEVSARRAASGATRLDAMVHEGNASGRAFWAGVGFHVDPDDRRWTRAITMYGHPGEALVDMKQYEM